MSNLTTTSPTKPRSTMRTGFKETPKGVLYFEFTNARVYAVRPRPARCWTADMGENPCWYGLKDPSLELGARIRELRLRDGASFPDVLDGEATAAARRDTPYYERRRENVRKLLAHIPVPLQGVLARFPNGTWALYRFLADSPAALELCASDDGARLAHTLAHAHCLLPHDAPAQRRSLGFARRLLPRKRREIAGALGLPATKATCTRGRRSRAATCRATCSPTRGSSSPTTNAARAPRTCRCSRRRW